VFAFVHISASDQTYNVSAASTSSLIDHGVELELESDRPPLLVKVTGYRLLTTAIIVTFGTVKAMAALDGAAVTSTTLDWVAGVILGTMLVWPDSSRSFVSDILEDYTG
jgi:hypothetical protein